MSYDVFIFFVMICEVRAPSVRQSFPGLILGLCLFRNSIKLLVRYGQFPFWNIIFVYMYIMKKYNGQYIIWAEISISKLQHNINQKFAIFYCFLQNYKEVRPCFDPKPPFLISETYVPSSIIRLKPNICEFPIFSLD